MTDKIEQIERPECLYFQKETGMCHAENLNKSCIDVNPCTAKSNLFMLERESALVNEQRQLAQIYLDAYKMKHGDRTALFIRQKRVLQEIDELINKVKNVPLHNVSDIYEIIQSKIKELKDVESI